VEPLLRNRGLSSAYAVPLLNEGALVGVNRKPDLDAAETLGMIKAAGGQAFDVAADMRDPKQVKAMVAEVAKRGGRLDYVVSNAAINPFMTWDNKSIEDFDNLFETNVRGAWVVCTEGARQMVAEGHGGAIVMISSISAHVGAPTQVAYCGTKGAISMLGKALGSVLGRHGIRVNVIEPGAVATNMALDLPALDAFICGRGAQEKPLAELKGDRIGLVAFAGSAFVQCPLTLDRNAFRESLEAVEVTRDENVAGQ